VVRRNATRGTTGRFVHVSKTSRVALKKVGLAARPGFTGKFLALLTMS
jgi:hypothetical protein